jgi:hypothetical protein
MQQSGDHFDITLADATGAILLSFSRDLHYDSRELCGEDCATGAIRVWPESPSGLTCSARTCVSGAAVTVEVALPDSYAGAILIELCRSDLCGSLSLPDFGYSGVISVGATAESLGGNRRRIRVTTQDDAAVLVDGDRYQLTITDDQMNVLATVDKTATYAETYPNGPDCDPYPCRWAEIVP